MEAGEETGSARPDATRRVLHSERVEGVQANRFRSARRSGEDAGLHAVAAVVTTAHESGEAGEVFGPASRPTNRPTSFSKCLTHSSRAANEFTQAQDTLPTAAESSPLHLLQI